MSDLSRLEQNLKCIFLNVYFLIFWWGHEHAEAKGLNEVVLLITLYHPEIRDLKSSSNVDPVAEFSTGDVGGDSLLFRSREFQIFQLSGAGSCILIWQ
jgi:hypothetical protein